MTLLNPALLLALPLVLLPVLLHLWQRRRERRVDFPAVVLLLGDNAATVRRRRLDEWLLLAVRMLIVAGLVTLFARPVIPVAPGNGEVVAAVALVMDDSASMQAKQDGRTRFETARNEALDLLQRLAPGSDVTLIFASQPHAALHTRDPATARTRLRRQGCSHEQVILRGAVAQALSRLQRSALPSRLLVVCSDAAGPALDDLPVRPVNGVQVKLLQVGTAQPNTGIVDLALHPRRPIAFGPCDLTATVQSFAADAPRTVAVRLNLEGHPAQKRQVVLPANGRATVRFTVVPQRPGPLTGHVELARDADALPTDDRRPIALNVRSPWRVHVTSADETATLLRTALQPYAAAHRARIDARSVPPELPLAGGARPDVVLVPRPEHLNASAWAALLAFAGQGGGVLVMAGPHAMPSDHALLPATWQQAKTLEAPARWQIREPSHPLMAAFAGGRNGDLPSVVVRRQAILQPVEAAQVPAGTRAGPLLVTQPVGQGRVLLLAVPPQPSWTSLPHHAAFLPFLHEAVAWCAKGGPGLAPWQSVGEALRPRLAAGHESGSLQGETPDGPVSLSGNNGRYEQTTTPGIYRFFSAAEGDSAPTEAAFAVWTAPAESDITPGDPASMARLQAHAGVRQSGTPPALHVGTAAELLASLPSTHRELFLPLLLILLLMMALEALLSRHRRSVAVAPASSAAPLKNVPAPSAQPVTGRALR